MSDFPYRRIVVIGVTGSGKTTVAGQLAACLGIPPIELDALYWGPDWTPALEVDFRYRAEVATSAPAWVLDGNYRVVRDIVWPRAEAIVWLDYPLGTVFAQLWQRTWKRCQTKELLWGTNQENLGSQLKFWSKDSLFNWLFRTYWRRKREYSDLLARPEYRHLIVFRFKSPQEISEFACDILRSTCPNRSSSPSLEK